MKKGLMVVLLIIMWTALLWGQETFLPYFRVGKFISADSLAVRTLKMTTGNMQLAHNSWIGIDDTCRIRFFDPDNSSHRLYCYGTLYTMNSLEIPSGQGITLNGNMAFDRDGNSHRFGWTDYGERIDVIYNDNINFVTNALARMSIANSGNVGIGDATPDVAFDVDVAAQFSQGVNFVGGGDTFNVSITSDKFTIKNDAGTPTTVFTVDSTGLMEIDSLKADQIIWQDGSVIVLSSGIATITHSYHLFDTEAGEALDTLYRINGGKVGMELIIEITNNSRQIFIDSNASGGNIYVSGGDFTLAERGDILTLIYTVQNAWRQKSYSNN